MVVLKGSCRYDTDNADVIRKYTYGAYGDPAGYEEILYRMRNRKNGKGGYFVYRFGGPESPYPQPQVNRILKEENVKSFLAERDGK